MDTNTFKAYYHTFRIDKENMNKNSQDKELEIYSLEYMKKWIKDHEDLFEQ